MSALPTVPVIRTEFVLWSDVDPVNITRYDAYVRMIELGEDTLFRAVGLTIPVIATRWDIWLPRKLMHVDYHSPSKLADAVTVAAYLSRLGETALTLNVDVLDGTGARLHASAHLVLVCVGRAAFDKRPLPAELRAMLAPLECSVDDARARVQASRGRG